MISNLPFKKYQRPLQEVTFTGQRIGSLADVCPGQRVRVVSFAPDLSPGQRAYLQSYGVLAGYWLIVVQQTPVTVIQVEHTELALENEVSTRICVTEEIETA